MSWKQRFRSVGRFSSGAGALALALVVIAASTLLSMPWVILAAGAQGFATIAAGQAVGVMVSVGIIYGWGLTGPAAVARVTVDAARDEYITSLVVRGVLVIPLIAAGVGLTWLVNRGDILLTTVSVASTALLGLRGGWYFLGRNNPWKVLLFEAVPRAAGIWLGVIVLVLAGSPAWVAIAIQSAGLLAASIVSTITVMRHDPRRLNDFLLFAKHVRIGAALRDRAHMVYAGLASSLFAASPILVVNLVAPGAAPVFSLISRVQSQAMTALSPLADYLQGWVPRAERTILRRRARVALAAGTIVAVVAGAGVLGFGDEVYGYLGAGIVQPSFAAQALAAAVLLVAFVVHISGPTLLPAMDRSRGLARNTLAGSVAGIIAVGGLAFLDGLDGALWGLLIGLTLTGVANVATLMRSARGDL